MTDMRAQQSGPAQSGPAQSVRKRLQYPVSDRMFMKMSGAPWALA